MAITAPPYALAPTPFPLPGIATYAGKAPLGGDREVAIACFVVARLAAALLPPQPLPTDMREKRAAACRGWLASQAVPPAVRSQLMTVADSTASADRSAVATAVRDLRANASKYLDARSENELDSLATKLTG